MSSTVKIERFQDKDAADLWGILCPTFRAGDTYTIDPNIAENDAVSYWTAPPKSAWIASVDGVVLGTYYLRPNADGGGDHVCNAGFMTAPAARGKGIAKAMLAHALSEAKSAGYRAMQFNFVVSTNTAAIAIWQKAGFDIVGRLPDAFDHPTEGFVDALVMFKSLQAP